MPKITVTFPDDVSEESLLQFANHLGLLAKPVAENHIELVHPATFSNVVGIRSTKNPVRVARMNSQPKGAA